MENEIFKLNIRLHLNFQFTFTVKYLLQTFLLSIITIKSKIIVNTSILLILFSVCNSCTSLLVFNKYVLLFKTLTELNNIAK